MVRHLHLLRQLPGEQTPRTVAYEKADFHYPAAHCCAVLRSSDADSSLMARVSGLQPILTVSPLNSCSALHCG